MNDFSQQAIETVANTPLAYCKFITRNDVGLTGGHQYGFHIHKAAWKILFSEEGARGDNKDRWVKIKWQDDFETESRFIYYGTGTRNEYRITNFGRDFPFLTDEMVGNLLVLCKVADEQYSAYVLQTENEIDDFLEYFGVSPLEANGLISNITETEYELSSLILEELGHFNGEFPNTSSIAEAARRAYDRFKNVTPQIVVDNPDAVIKGWIDTETSLFSELEKIAYKKHLENRFESVDDLASVANEILNRRKSRAGRSLEHHLAKIFDYHKLPYSAQEITEGRKKPDFIIPSITFYRDESYSSEKLIFLGAKTTCKDRWRQVLNEADRIPKKHLFTLQPGISSHQLEEMRDFNLTLVVPEILMSKYPEDASNVMSLKNFITFSKSKIV